MTLALRVVFGVLVAATFGAFFVAQRLKNSPPVLGQIGVTPVFSPNRDGRLDRAVVSFKLKQADRIAVTVIDARDDEVRELTGGRDAAAGELERFKWDGRDDAGRPVADGRYRFRVALQRQGRSVRVPKSIRLDVTPPRPLVASIGPFRAPGPELLPLPGGRPAEVHLRAPARGLRVLLFKTGPGAPRLVGSWDHPGTTWRWDGRTGDGRPVSPGSYLVAVEARDRAGNVGRSVALDARGLPVAPFGRALPGRGGITVRYLGVVAPAAPTAAGQLARFFVDSRQERYSWTVRRVGSGRVVARGAKTKPALALHAPAGDSGAYLLEVHTRTHALRTPFLVRGRARSPVLVVLPTMTWQGRNAVDADGDGLPDVLDRGVRVGLGRMLGGDGLPAGFATREAPLLAWLDRAHHRYDVTTDALLGTRQGPRLAGYRGVLLPSDTRWLPRATLLALRAYVRAGGTLASFGVDSLRRQVSRAGGDLVAPTPPASVDALGARLGPVRRLAAPVRLIDATDSSAVQLFQGTTGAFAGYSTLEDLAPGPGLLSWATVEQPPGERPVIAASRLGRGLVLRYPLPELPAKLSPSAPDQQAVALLQRAWTLLSR
jgi:hypothetical protein